MYDAYPSLHSASANHHAGRQENGSEGSGGDLKAIERADLFDGIDTTWARYGEVGAGIGRHLEQAIAEFKGDDPSASVPALIALRAKLAALPGDAAVEVDGLFEVS